MPATDPNLGLQLPTLFFVALLVLAALLTEAVFKRRRIWALPAAFLYLTVFAWYFVDLFINPDDYRYFSEALLNLSYSQVIGFLLLYRWFTPKLVGRIARNAVTALPDSRFVNPEKIFTVTAVAWAILLTIGVTIMGGDLLGALFPLGARTGSMLWGREGGSGAGASGFLISTAGYVYLLVCASFGVWLLFLRRVPLKFFALALLLVSWPSFLLSGTRSGFLAVCLPSLFAYMLFGRQPVWIRIVVLCIAFLGLNLALRVVLTYRNIGFQTLVSGETNEDKPEELSEHKGLNMIQELCYTNLFVAERQPLYGALYLQEAVSVVPRAIWPSKPMLTLEYAVWRGFGGADNDLGVFATVSSGMIGGGILNFGSALGPVAPAILMSLWTALLARWWTQRASLLRRFLFLAGLGLTFNLGRDITLLVLWPIIFGYVIVLMVEKFAPSTRRSRLRRAGGAAVRAKPTNPRLGGRLAVRLDHRTR